MMESRARPVSKNGGAIQLISRLLFIIAGLFIHIRAILFVMSGLHREAWLIILAAASLYMLSQLIRACRLIVIVGDPRISIKRLGCAHFIGAAASFIMPFKIGDLLRLTEIAHVLQRPRSTGFWQAFTVMWIERVYDAVMVGILLGLVAMNAEPATMATILPIVLSLAAFVIVTIVVFFILPENLDDLALFIARRYSGAGTVRTLRYISRIHGLISEARRLLRYKQVTIFGLSAAIWGIEAAVVDIVIRNGFSGSVTILLGFLSGAMSVTSTQRFNISDYAWSIGMPLLLIALVAWYAQLLAGRIGGDDTKEARRGALNSA